MSAAGKRSAMVGAQRTRAVLLRKIDRAGEQQIADRAAVTRHVRWARMTNARRAFVSTTATAAAAVNKIKQPGGPR